ncbi:MULTISPECIES: Repetin [Streptomyces]|uniref:Repetin n=2 Tax=Streptomyces rochei group TaxID=2867164 RepID=A0AAX3ZDU6_STRRO|nr:MULTISPECIES: Repetin [Streptomyces]MBU8548617.1 Repetin [Streptomyces sp. Osf17]MBU8555392.1 Repetin [Streptomyces sp. Babs14]NUV96696.1 Repetin [Streptomyces sp. KAI 90]QCB21590.1 Repetin [Streptomyces sp. SS52]RSS22032.1 Repetin [Streptomyces sp. WAC05458]
MKRRTTTAALCAALLLTAVTTGAAVATGPHEGQPPREAAALTGTAGLYRSAGDDITFAFDAHLAAEHRDDPLEATGTFEFSHYLNGEGARAKAEVDCLITGGDVAVVTGVVTDSDLPGAEGRRVGVTVHDLGRHDRLGYSWAATGSPAEGGELPRCVSSAPFEKVARGTGDFRVVPWQPRL